MTIIAMEECGLSLLCAQPASVEAAFLSGFCKACCSFRCFLSTDILQLFEQRLKKHFSNCSVLAAGTRKFFKA